MLHDFALMLNQTQQAEIQTQFNLGLTWEGWASDTSARVCVWGWHCPLGIVTSDYR